MVNLNQRINIRSLFASPYSCDGGLHKNHQYNGIFEQVHHLLRKGFPLNASHPYKDTRHFNHPVYKKYGHHLVLSKHGWKPKKHSRYGKKKIL